MTHIFIIGLNHVSAPLDIREKFALEGDSRLTVLADLSAIVDEVVFLSTCNRTEVIYSAAAVEKHDHVRGFIQRLGDLTLDQFEQFFYCHSDRTALTHLFRVAAGLDSMIPGETQILGQMKRAFDDSFRHGYTSGNFERIYQHMLNTAKTIRTETDIGKGSVSVGTVAVQLAGNIFGDLDDKAVVLIGAGEMSENAAEQFHRVGVGAFKVVNRSIERAAELAARFGGVPYGLDEIRTPLIAADVVVCSVSSQGYVIDRTLAGDIMEARRNRALFIIDIAVPRNVEPQVHEIPEIYVYNIDDLKKLVDRNLDGRIAQIARGEAMIADRVDELSSYDRRVLSGLIQSLQERVTEIKVKELEKLFRRNEAFTEDGRAQIEQAVNQIVNKILHDPIISLRRELQKRERGSRKIVDIFKDFFNL